MPAPERSIEDLVEAALPSLVLLLNTRPDGKRSYGSGLLLDDQGTVLTNLHVVANAESLSAMLYRADRVSYTPADGGLWRFLFENSHEIKGAFLVRADPTLDLAVVRVDADTSALPARRISEGGRRRPVVGVDLGPQPRRQRVPALGALGEGRSRLARASRPLAARGSEARQGGATEPGAAGRRERRADRMEEDVLEVSGSGHLPRRGAAAGRQRGRRRDWSQPTGCDRRRLSGTHDHAGHLRLSGRVSGLRRRPPREVRGDRAPRGWR
ncbi:MAG: trypsin-like peptidase domain-containing protein [Myxococcales bacterium]|nr:trypsin-like peptidase domain-containing protein [Myxococcales bacterium]